MACIELPFALPCHLSFTSHIRPTGSHAGGNAVDISPLIHGVDERTKTAIYLKSYLILWAHLTRNRFRINIAKNNRHFHFEINPEVWEFGFEQYEAREKTVMDGATPKKVVYEVALSDPVNYDARKVGANLKFQSMLSVIEKLWIGYFPSIGGTVQALVQLFTEITLEEYSPAKIYYDESIISTENAKRFADEFSKDIQWFPSNPYNPWKPQDVHDKIDEYKSYLEFAKNAAIAFFAVYLIDRIDKIGK